MKQIILHIRNGGKGTDIIFPCEEYIRNFCKKAVFMLNFITVSLRVTKGFYKIRKKKYSIIKQKIMI